jgi:hypothetical protein
VCVCVCVCVLLRMEARACAGGTNAVPLNRTLALSRLSVQVSESWNFPLSLAQRNAWLLLDTHRKLSCVTRHREEEGMPECDG